MRALDAAQKFVRTQMTTADMVSIMRYDGGSVDILQDFTDNRNRLLSILETLVVGEGQGMRSTPPTTPSSADTGAAFGQDDSPSSTSSTPTGNCPRCKPRRTCWASVNEKKSLLYFASGLRLNGIDNQAQMHATADEAIKARRFHLDDRCARPDRRGVHGRCHARLARRRRPCTPAASAQAVTTNFQ